MFILPTRALHGVLHQITGKEESIIFATNVLCFFACLCKCVCVSVRVCLCVCMHKYVGVSVFIYLLACASSRTPYKYQNLRMFKSLL